MFVKKVDRHGKLTRAIVCRGQMSDDHYSTELDGKVELVCLFFKDEDGKEVALTVRRSEYEKMKEMFGDKS